MTNVLRSHELHSYYGKSHILHGVSLEVNEGEIVTVLGRNGAGKTTTVRSLIGLIRRDMARPSCLGRILRVGRHTELPSWASATSRKAAKYLAT